MATSPQTQPRPPAVAASEPVVRFVYFDKLKQSVYGCETVLEHPWKPHVQIVISLLVCCVMSDSEPVGNFKEVTFVLAFKNFLGLRTEKFQNIKKTPDCITLRVDRGTMAAKLLNGSVDAVHNVRFVGRSNWRIDKAVQLWVK